MRPAEELVVGGAEVEVVESDVDELRQSAGDFTRMIEAGAGDVEELGIALASMRGEWLEPSLVVALESGNLFGRGAEACIEALDEMGETACDALEGLLDRGVLGWPFLRKELRCFQDEPGEERSPCR